MQRGVMALACSMTFCGGVYDGSVFGDSSGPGRGGSAGAAQPSVAYHLTRSVVSSTVAQNGWAPDYPYQKKVFYASGLYWVFYSDGGDQAYRTSSDGVSWSTAAIARSGGLLGHRIGYWYDGAYIHYAYCDASVGSDVFYRRGSLGADGIITWSAAEQTVLAVDVSHAVGYPMVRVDSSGYPWVNFMYAAAPSWTAPYAMYVIKASANDGTWTTAGGFPYTFVSGYSAVYSHGVGAVMTNGKMFYVTTSDDNTDGHPLIGRLWNGSSWGSQEDVTVTGTHAHTFDVYAEGDTLHLVFEAVTEKNIYYRRRDSSSGWGTEHLVTTGLPADAIPALTSTGTEALRAYWPASNEMYYRDILNGTTNGVAAVLEDETVSTFPGPLLINQNALVSSPGDLLLVYSVGDASPFQVIAVLQSRN